jgi:Lipocalin-like domain
MTSKMLGAIALLFLLASSEIAAAQDLASQLVGVWKRTDYIRKFADGEIAKPLGETISGMMIFSAGGHFTMVMNRNDRKAGTTDAELAALYRSAFSGGGTYKVEGDEVVCRYDTSSSPTFVGAEQRFTATISGKKLTWISPEFKTETGRAYNNIFTQERLE